MRLRKQIVTGIIGFFILLTAGCDVVPSAKEAAEANTDRSKFQAPNAQSKPVSDTLFLHEKLTNGIPYYYAVSASTDTGESNLSQVISATPDFKALPAVDAAIDGVSKADQYVIVVGDQRNTLYWPSVAGATSYSIYWSNATTAEVSLQDTRIDFVQSPFVHDALENDTAYHYVVVANNFEKPGQLPAIKTGTPFKPKPTAPSAIALTYATDANTTTAQLTLNFTDVSNAETFTLYWKTTPGATVSGTNSQIL